MHPAPHGGTSQEWREWAERLNLPRAFGARCSDVGDGRAVLVLEESPVPLNPNGSVHGGVVAATADAAMGIAFMTGEPEGVLPATASLTVNYHRPAFLPLTFSAEVARRGRTIVFCDVEVTTGDGDVSTVCHGVMSVRGRTAPEPAAP